MHCLTDLTETLWMWKRGARICGRIDSKRQVVAWGFRGKEVKGSLTRVSSEDLSNQSVQTEKPNNNNSNNKPIKATSCSCHCLKSKYRIQKSEITIIIGYMCLTSPASIDHPKSWHIGPHHPPNQRAERSRALPQACALAPYRLCSAF